MSDCNCYQGSKVEPGKVKVIVDTKDRLATAGAATPPANAQLVYNGGPLLANVDLVNVYWGDVWSSDSSLAQERNDLDSFMKFLVTSSLVDQLSEYDVPNYSIGHGVFSGSVLVPDGGTPPPPPPPPVPPPPPPPPPTGCLTKLFAPRAYLRVKAPALPSVVNDTDIVKMLRANIQSGVLTPPNVNRLYFVWIPPGVTVQMGQDTSCNVFCGYHSNDGTDLFYAVMPSPDCVGCLTTSRFASLTQVGSHEFCEAITDPIPGSGWYDQANGEIGDICAWNTKQLGGYTVQLEWSNKMGSCV